MSAPGIDIVSAYIDRANTHPNAYWYRQLSGTSMAAPIVTGLAVLLKSEDGSLNVRELKNLIYTSSGSTQFTADNGFGRINAVNAVSNLYLSALPSQIVLNRTSAGMYAGESLNLEYAVYPAAASRYADEAVFSSDNSGVASVDSSGMVTAKAAGTANITVVCGEAKEACQVTVKDMSYKLISSLPYCDTGYFEPMDPKTCVKDADELFEAIVDGYELNAITAGKPITISVKSSTAVPYAAVFDPSGTETEVTGKPVVNTSSGSYILNASFTPAQTGRYRVHILGRTDGSTAVLKEYSLAIDYAENGNVQTAPAKNSVVYANGLTARGKTVKIKRSKLKKKPKTIAAGKAVSVSGANGTVSYHKVRGSKKLSISSTGTVKVKKKTGKGTYKMIVRVSASGDSNHYSASKNVTVTVKVR